MASETVLLKLRVGNRFAALAAPGALPNQEQMRELAASACGEQGGLDDAQLAAASAIAGIEPPRLDHRSRRIGEDDTSSRRARRARPATPGRGSGGAHEEGGGRRRARGGRHGIESACAARGLRMALGRRSGGWSAMVAPGHRGDRRGDRAALLGPQRFVLRRGDRVVVDEAGMVDLQQRGCARKRARGDRRGDRDDRRPAAKLRRSAMSARWRCSRARRPRRRAPGRASLRRSAIRRAHAAAAAGVDVRRSDGGCRGARRRRSRRLASPARMPRTTRWSTHGSSGSVAASGWRSSSQPTTTQTQSARRSSSAGSMRAN